MSRYLVLIRADIAEAESLYALTTSSDPAIGLKSLQAYCPVPLTFIHAITANNRTEDLERTLQIKYQSQRRHSFWYNLTPEDVDFIQTITENNLMRVTGLIKRALAPPPQVNGKPVADALQEALALCDKLSNKSE